MVRGLRRLGRGKTKLVRKRRYDDLNREKNFYKRLQVGDYLVRRFNAQLRAGITIGEEKLSTHANNFKEVTVGEALSFFIKQKTIDKHRVNYIRTFSKLKNVWAMWLQEKVIPDFLLRKLDASDMRSFFLYIQQKRKVSNKTFNNYRNDFATFINWIRKRSPTMLRTNPIEGIDRLKVVSKKHAALTDAQMKAVKKTCKEMGYHQLLLMINFIYYTLARPGELRALKIRHIEVKDNRIFIPGDISKNGNDEYVAIAPQLKKLIKSSGILKYDPDFFIFGKNQVPGPDHPYGNSFWERNVKVLEKLKLNDRPYDVYSYKHSGAISLYKACRDMQVVKRQCRHASIEQTDAYLRDLGLMSDYDALAGWKGAI